MTATPKPVVFIPGLLGDEAMYQAVIEKLADVIDAQVLVLAEPTMQQNVATLLAQAPPTFVLVGTSYGGSVALEVALAAPERVTALWLMGCNPAAPDANVQKLVGGLEAMPDAVIDMLAGLAVSEEATEAAVAFKEMADRVGAKAGADQARALGSRSEVVSRLGELRMPALVLWGAQDRIVPVEVGRALAEELPHAHFHVLPKCGHIPTLENPIECADIFVAFLESEEAHWH
jgi:pimeloyl-ACP methyl ester carboxylesterase